MEQNAPLKPDNNMILAIFTTLCCCLPLGIVAIIKASNVNNLYMMKQYDAAIQASADAKKWSLIGIGLGVVFQVIYIIFYGAAVFASLS